MSDLDGRSILAGADGFDIVDCDVHPNADRGVQSVYPYMPEPWRQRFLRKRSHQLGTQLTIKFNHPNGSLQRDDARAHGRTAGSDPAYLVSDLVDKYRLSTVVLNSLQSCALCVALANTEESIVFASAFNDFFLDKWLLLDRRFTFAMVVPSQDPTAAVCENRTGRRPCAGRGRGAAVEGGKGLTSDREGALW